MPEFLIYGDGVRIYIFLQLNPSIKFRALIFK